MRDKTRQSLWLFLADWFTPLPFKTSQILESLFPFIRDQPLSISSPHTCAALRWCYMTMRVWLQQLQPSQQLACHRECVHTSSHAHGDGRLTLLAKGFNPQRRCLNLAPCCHGNRSGKRVGYRGEVARGQGTLYV